MSISRREMMKMIASAAPAMCFGKALARADDGQAEGPDAAAVTGLELPPAPEHMSAPKGFGVATGPFEPNWESLSAYQIPDWYRDAKLGIWAHWGPQCQPEMGDWYAQKMYQPKRSAAVYQSHVQKYGHPSKFGFKDVINEWKADKWDPDYLIALYKKAGAKFFAAMANHHDNMDMFDSKYQPSNSVAIGPKKDIVGLWAKAARAAGLRFAVTSHGDRAWSWYQDAQGSDPSGPSAGVPYDGRTPKSAGQGLWWEGLDPQDLYAQYHAVGKYGWTQSGDPPIDQNYIDKFFNRTIDLIDKYHPDLLYFDDTILPLYPASDIGLRIAAYFYNTNLALNGKLEAVLTGKGLNAQQRRALVLDVERGVTNGGETIPWQTDTCIGSWHYERRLFDQHRYKSPLQVVQMLIDIVSKNGNLMLNIPLRGDGTIDDDELKVVEGLASWIAMNGEGIYETRPWKTYGEGPSVSAQAPRGRFGGTRDVRSYTAEDFRFTSKGETLYVFAMKWPDDGKLTIKALADGSEFYPKRVAKVELLGTGAVSHEQTREALVITLPEKKTNDFAFTLKVTSA